MKRVLLAAALGAMTYAVPDDAAAATCPSNLRGLQALTCTCTPGQLSGSVWGSGPYTSDSTLCAAALHAGAIAKTGGTITVEATVGCSSYRGSRNNGVTSSDFGAWHSSFYFPAVGSPNCSGAAKKAAPVAVAPCPETYQGHRGALTCQCTPAAFYGEVWGSATYSDASSVCNAALHAGAVARTGGVVTVQATRGCAFYDGHMNNGVASADSPGGAHSFFFPSVSNGACPAERPGWGPGPGGRLPGR